MTATVRQKPLNKAASGGSSDTNGWGTIGWDTNGWDAISWDTNGRFLIAGRKQTRVTHGCDPKTDNDCNSQTETSKQSSVEEAARTSMTG